MLVRLFRQKAPKRNNNQLQKQLCTCTEKADYRSRYELMTTDDSTSIADVDENYYDSAVDSNDSPVCEINDVVTMSKDEFST